LEGGGGGFEYHFGWDGGCFERSFAIERSGDTWVTLATLPGTGCLQMQQNVSDASGRAAHRLQDTE